MATCNDNYLDYNDEDDDDDIDLINHSSYLQSSDSEREDVDESVFQPKEPINESDEDDDFEKDMAVELSNTMTLLTAPLRHDVVVSGKTPSNKKVSFAKTENKDSEFYDDVYFDSDGSSDENTGPPSIRKKLRSKHRVLSNDELFYDPDMDERDQAWVDKTRRSYQVKQKKSGKIGKNGMKRCSEALPETDAVLNCPACLTTLCLDSQRHAIYDNQYRAMFVFHCKVDFAERLKFPEKTKNKFMKEKKNKAKLRKKMKEAEFTDKISVEASTSKHTSAVDDVIESSQSDPTKSPNNIENLVQTEPKNINESINNSNRDNQVDDKFLSMESVTVDALNVAVDDTEYFNPVSCDICNTKVAVYDKDEVYHFFNIVTSY